LSDKLKPYTTLNMIERVVFLPIPYITFVE
jgi:hypothetical protein